MRFPIKVSIVVQCTVNVVQSAELFKWLAKFKVELFSLWFHLHLSSHNDSGVSQGRLYAKFDFKSQKNYHRLKGPKVEMNGLNVLLVRNAERDKHNDDDEKNLFDEREKTTFTTIQCQWNELARTKRVHFWRSIIPHKSSIYEMNDKRITGVT